MSFQTAGLVGGIAFLLSFAAGLIGGVPFFDIVVRALFWAALGFGASLGIESLLRSLLPDLFVPVAVEAETAEAAPERMVDIVLDEERPGRSESVIEEVEADDEVLAEVVEAPTTIEREAQTEAPSAVRPLPAAAGPAGPADSAEADEEMPEIGSFLDAFKPNAPSGDEEGEESAAPAPPEYGDYAPRAESPASAAKEVTIDGETQDPQILAKAVQTVMKRDTQGS